MTATQTDATVPAEFRQIIESFYGSTCGNTRSPVWICGLEWGGGHDPAIPIPVSDFEPYVFDDLQVWSADDFLSSFWAPQSRFCQAVIKILTGLRDRAYVPSRCSWSRENMIKENLIGPNGLALILNAFPISMSGTSARWSSWLQYQVRLNDGTVKPLSEWTQLPTFDKYREYLFAHRTRIYSQEVQNRKPQLIICFGMNEGHERLFGAEKIKETFSSVPDGGHDCTVYEIEHREGFTKTLVLVTPFPVGRYGLISDAQFDVVSKKISEIGTDTFKDRWLADWPRGDTPEACKSLLSDSELTKLDTLKNELHDLNRLISAINQEVSIIESLAHSELCSSLGDLKKSQIQAMTDILSETKQVKSEIRLMEAEFRKRL